MSYNFSTEDKEANEFSPRIPFGISEVQLSGVTAGETEAGKDFIEVTVVDKDGTEDSARVWFVGGAAKYSFDTLRAIVVHTAKTDADKEKARAAVEACTNNEELASLMNTKCSGGQIWFTKYFNPTRTYSSTSGVTLRSVDKSVLGYEPKLKAELMPDTSGGEITMDNIDKVFPGAETVKIDAGASVPKSWQ